MFDGAEQLDVDGILRFARTVLREPARFWTESGLEQKKRFQQVVFPSGITFGPSGVGTATTSIVFNGLQENRKAETRMATPAGFEPALPP